MVSLAPQVGPTTNTAIPPYHIKFMINGAMPGGAAITASGANSPTATAAMAFDDNLATEWQDLTVPNGSNNFAWLQYAYPSNAMHVVNRYSLTSTKRSGQRSQRLAALWPGRLGRTYLFARHPDQSDSSSRLEPLSFSITNTTGYRGYRLVITSVNNPATRLGAVAIWPNWN